jgi:hypothetical protein
MDSEESALQPPTIALAPIIRQLLIRISCNGLRVCPEAYRVSPHYEVVESSSASGAGRMFAPSLKTLSGSYVALILASRAYFSGP